MPTFRRLLVAALLALALVSSDAVTTSGPALAARTAPSYTASITKPCGKLHYPPCPPKPWRHVFPTTQHRGRYIYINLRHYRPYVWITVHLAGWGRYYALGRAVTNKYGNRFFRVRTPRRAHPGYYTLYLKVGSKLYAYRIHLLR